MVEISTIPFFIFRMCRAAGPTDEYLYERYFKSKVLFTSLQIDMARDTYWIDENNFKYGGHPGIQSNQNVTNELVPRITEVGLKS